MGASQREEGGRALGTLSLSGTLLAPAVGHTPLVGCEMRGPQPAFKNWGAQIACARDRTYGAVRPSCSPMVSVQEEQKWTWT